MTRVADSSRKALMHGFRLTSGRPSAAVNTKRGIGMLCLLLFLSTRMQGMAQSLTGTTGLITVPTAGLAKDGEVLSGVSIGNRKYNVQKPKFHDYSYFITIGFLPFLEVSLLLHRNYHFVWTDELTEMTGLTSQGIGDRMASVRLRLIGEKKYLPSMVLGAHDFFSAFGKSTEVTFHNALYVAFSKKLRPPGFPVRFGLHAGYGTDWMKANHHDFVGIFGGVSVEAGSWMTLMAEYDTEKFNGGAAFHFFRHIQVLLALKNFNTFAGSLGYSFRLH
jgi:hypothetical protein